MSDRIYYAIGDVHGEAEKLDRLQPPPRAARRVPPARRAPPDPATRLPVATRLTTRLA